MPFLFKQQLPLPPARRAEASLPERWRGFKSYDHLLAGQLGLFKGLVLLVFPEGPKRDDRSRLVGPTHLVSYNTTVLAGASGHYLSPGYPTYLMSRNVRISTTFQDQGTVWFHLSGIHTPAFQANSFHLPRGAKSPKFLFYHQSLAHTSSAQTISSDSAPRVLRMKTHDNGSSIERS